MKESVLTYVVPLDAVSHEFIIAILLTIIRPYSFLENLMDFNEACLHEATLYLHTHA